MLSMDDVGSTAQLELSVCDQDLKDHFGATKEHEECVYSPGLPSSIQLNRLLRELIIVLNNSNNNTCNCSNSKDNV